MLVRIGIVTVAACAASAAAQPNFNKSHVFTVSQANGKLARFGSVDDGAGDIYLIDAVYTSQKARLTPTRSLVVTVTADDSVDGFVLAFGPTGVSPRGTAGSVAMIYYDRGRGGGTFNVSAYVYNGQSDASSFLMPGSFIASRTDGTGRLDTNARIRRVRSANTLPGSRNFAFAVDPSVIQAHMPSTPGADPWSGVWFGRPASMWLTTFSNGGTRPLGTYNADGSLASWSFDTQGGWEGQGIGARIVPTPTAAGLGLLGVGIVAARRRR